MLLAHFALVIWLRLDTQITSGRCSCPFRQKRSRNSPSGLVRRWLHTTITCHYFALCSRSLSHPVPLISTLAPLRASSNSRNCLQFLSSRLLKSTLAGPDMHSRSLLLIGDIHAAMWLAAPASCAHTAMDASGNWLSEASVVKEVDGFTFN